MGSTIRSTGPPILLHTTTTESIRWRSWPLVDHASWSWTVIAGIALIGGFVVWMGGSWILATLVIAALAVIFWQYLVPVSFELTPLGLRRYALRRVRLVPWQAIRAYQLRTTGVIFFQRPTPTKIDVLSGLFVPYPADEDEMVVAVRMYLPHATELTE
jgi:hypothetical protein